jgi:hypothetical protein
MNASLRKKSFLPLLMLGAVLGAFLLSTVAASAQDMNSNNVFAGYSLIGANLFSGEHVNLNGWNISAEKKYLPFFGIVGDVSGLYGSKNLPGSTACVAANCMVHGDVSEYTFDFGIRGSYAAKTFRPFAEALFGAARVLESGPGLTNNSFGFDSMLGAGLDCRLTRMLGCRVDVDYIVTGSFNARQNSIRASTGLVLRF